MVNFEKYLEENPEQKEKYEALTDEEREAVKTVYIRLTTLWEVAKAAVKVCEKNVSLYPNKRVIHLAKHSKKERVRKKNIHRIVKDVQRYSRENKKGVSDSVGKQN